MTIEEEIVNKNKELLLAIDTKDWLKYKELVDETITCFEPEAKGNLVGGLDFHHYYFTLDSNAKPKSTIVNAHVRMIGENSAIVSYIRVIQLISIKRDVVEPLTKTYEETRVWQLLPLPNSPLYSWRNVHFHRSSLP